MSLFSAKDAGDTHDKKGGKSVILQFDGGSRGNPGPAGIGLTLSDETGDVFYELGEYLGNCTNNVAEYTALVRGLTAAKAVGASDLTVRADSELVVRQINGIYKVKSPDLKPLYQRAVALIEEIRNVKVVHIYREGNTRADELANIAMDRGGKVEPLGPLGGFGKPPKKREKPVESQRESGPAPAASIPGLEGFQRTLRLIQAEEKELSLREIEALLLVADTPGITQVEISHGMELSDAAVYRLVVEGLVLRSKLLRQQKDPADDAPPQFFLTDNGRKLLQRIAAALLQ